MKARFYDNTVVLGLAAALLGLAGCSGDTNPVRDVLVTTGVGTEPKPAPDFVAASRPETIDYIPVGTAPEKVKAKTADQVKSAESAMEQTRAANERRAASARELGSKPAPSAPAGQRTP
jgi:hypothetical protein